MIFSVAFTTLLYVSKAARTRGTVSASSSSGCGLAAGGPCSAPFARRCGLPDAAAAGGALRMYRTRAPARSAIGCTLASPLGSPPRPAAVYFLLSTSVSRVGRRRGGARRSVAAAPSPSSSGPPSSSSRPWWSRLVRRRRRCCCSRCRSSASMMCAIFDLTNRRTFPSWITTRLGSRPVPAESPRSTARLSSLGLMMRSYTAEPRYARVARPLTVS